MMCIHRLAISPHADGIPKSVPEGVAHQRLDTGLRSIPAPRLLCQVEPMAALTHALI
jgi:hypothetical protein